MTQSRSHTRIRLEWSARMPLTYIKIRQAKPADKSIKLADTAGLYLEVKPSGSKLWRYRYRIAGRENLFAIDEYPQVSLADARDDARELIRQGRHPAHERRPPHHGDRAAPAAAERASSITQSMRRDPAVRLAGLQRADGRCELCDAEGFRMGDGRLFAETHHVQPLAERGVDRVWNVVALCPTHHREAHCGSRRVQMKAQLLELLATMYPQQAGKQTGPGA